MLLKCVLVLVSLYNFVPESHEADPSKLEALLEYTELSYEEACQDVANAEWAFINNPTNNTLLIAWEQAQGNYSALKKDEIAEIHNLTDNETDSVLLTYKLNVAKKPGDTLLNSTAWNNLVSFSGKAAILRIGANHSDGSLHDSRHDKELLLSGTAKIEDKRSTWSTWHRQLSPLLQTFPSTLALVSEAAKVNDAESVTAYWELLSGQNGGYEKIEELWEEISALHKKLSSFVQNRLAQKYKVALDNNGIPAYLLGSLNGYDWTFIASDVMPYGNISYSLQRGLWEKNLRGISLYKSAAKLGKSVLKEMPHADFWQKSKFNQKCHTQLVNFCREGATRVSTCHQASLSNYLTAQKIVAKVLLNQMKLESMPFLNVANRYSGLDEGVAELFSILSVGPGQLKASKLIDNDTDTEHSQITSLMITALDVLPRLAYYISVDLWRINVINNKTLQPNEIVESWWDYRKKYEGVISESVDIPTFLNDEFITSNKPYLSKFLGIILGFQLYKHLTGVTEVRYDGTTRFEMQNEFIRTIQQGGADDWTRIIRTDLELDDITFDALKSYFEPLEEFLDNNPDDIYFLSNNQELELERLEKYYKSIDVTRPPVTTTTATLLRTSAPKDLKIPHGKKDATNHPSLPPVVPPSNTSSERDNIKKESDHKPYVETDAKLQGTTDGDSEYTDKMNTSKAVWAVAAVLVATIAICVIAIFGRRRCVKSQTPKNRRYV